MEDSNLCSISQKDICLGIKITSYINNFQSSNHVRSSNAIRPSYFYLTFKLQLLLPQNQGTNQADTSRSLELKNTIVIPIVLENTIVQPIEQTPFKQRHRQFSFNNAFPSYFSTCCNPFSIH